MSRNIFSSLLIFIAMMVSTAAFSGDQQHDQEGHDHSSHNHDDHGHENACGINLEKGPYNPGAAAFHHISDQNVYNIGPLQLPLPCIMYIHGEGFNVFSSGRFDADGHGIGRKAYDKFVLFEGLASRVIDPSFPDGEVILGDHNVYALPKDIDGKENEIVYVCYQGKSWETESRSTLDGGVFGGGITSFTDFSITKNVLSMILILLFGYFLFRKVAKAYEERQGMAPTGTQGFIEPIFIFMQDEVCKPFLGNKWQKFQPFIMALFFFILFLNLFGQIPFLGGSNVTGSLSVTFVLAILTFFVVNLNGNKHYWEHVFWMPGVPAWVKIFVLSLVEIMGLFIKPLTLLLRLFGNITAGHMIITIFVGLIFVFGKSGQNVPGSIGAIFGSTVLTLFMMAIELLVAFIQAFVFAILTASYIGAATEEAHH
jgi:F-type H+-transporting ATPase subunit a